MKKTLSKRLTAAALSVLLALSAPSALAAAAPSPGVNYRGANSWEVTPARVYATGSNTEITDFFGDVTKNMVPGDSRTVAGNNAITVLLKNTDSREVTFGLRAETLTAAVAAGLTGANGPDNITARTGSDFADKTASDALLEQIQIKLTVDTKELYGGTLSGLIGRSGANTGDWLTIGRVSPGWNGVLTIEIVVPNLGNDYQGTLAAVDLQFGVEYDTVYYPPTSPSPSPSSSPDPEASPSPDPGASPDPSAVPSAAPSAPPLIDIGDDAPPLIDIDPDQTPQSDYEVVPPKTGDDSVLLWTILCTGSVAVLSVWLTTAIVRRRKAR
ncbi:MAG: hypothetical protein LBS90_09010 [Oscillospiraceae bacterium]|jgi:hypothetical protein|nr:hypothetical protein [Oscillospiraceae bacterium]